MNDTTTDTPSVDSVNSTHSTPLIDQIQHQYNQLLQQYHHQLNILQHKSQIIHELHNTMHNKDNHPMRNKLNQSQLQYINYQMK